MTGYTPLLSILMPVYNAEAYLAEALDSVLGQSHTDFELLCIEDGSTDASRDVLAYYSENDSRIRVIRNEENRGVAFSLNRGLEEARGKLIARMDSDDVCLPERLTRQVGFMGANPDVQICGGAMEIYETGALFSLPLTDAAVRIHILWGSPFCHPAVMFRRKFVLGVQGYRESMVPAEDYDLWGRLSLMPGCRFANLDAVLLRYRAYPGKNRKDYIHQQHEKALEVAGNLLQSLGIETFEQDREAHAVLMGHKSRNKIPPKRIEDWVGKLIQCNRKRQLHEPVLFEKMCYEQLCSVIVRADWIPYRIKQLIPQRVKKNIKRFFLLNPW